MKPVPKKTQEILVIIGVILLGILKEKPEAHTPAEDGVKKRNKTMVKSTVELIGILKGQLNQVLRVQMGKYLNKFIQTKAGS